MPDPNSWKILDPILWEKYGLPGLFGLALVAIIIILVGYVLWGLIPKLFRLFSAELTREREHAAQQSAAEREHCTRNHDEEVKLLMAMRVENLGEHERTRGHTTEVFHQLTRQIDSLKKNEE